MIEWIALGFASLSLILSGGLWAVIATMKWWLPRVGPQLLASRKPSTVLDFTKHP